MAVNKVVFSGNTLIDLTGDTVTPENLAQGVTAHDASGNPIVGKMTSGGSASSDLPAGYERVSFILFNGGQIVDTGVVCNQDTKIKVIYTRESSESMYLYGVASTGNTASITAYLGGYWRFGSKAVTRTVSTSADLLHTVIHDKTGVDSIATKNTYSGVTDFETIGSLLIGGGRNASGTVGVASYVGKIFLIEMWQGAELVLRLIPVKGTSGHYRFYDTISGEFHDSITNKQLDGGNL